MVSIHLIFNPSFLQYLDELSAAGEMRLFKEFFDVGVYMVPGHWCYMDTPGWFRVTFTRHVPYLHKGKFDM